MTQVSFSFMMMINYENANKKTDNAIRDQIQLFFNLVMIIVVCGSKIIKTIFMQELFLVQIMNILKLVYGPMEIYFFQVRVITNFLQKKWKYTKLFLTNDK